MLPLKWMGMGRGGWLGSGRGRRGLTSFVGSDQLVGGFPADLGAWSQPRGVHALVKPALCMWMCVAVRESGRSRDANHNTEKKKSWPKRQNKNIFFI